VYVFSSAEVHNDASYTLSLQAGDPLYGTQTKAPPVIDADVLSQPPKVGPIP
jgi:hypothetical protein